MTMLPFGEVAPIQRRVVAYILDLLIAAVIPVVGMIVVTGMLAGAATSADPTAAVFTVFFVVLPVLSLLELAWFIVYTLMQTGKGSIGMRAQGLRLVSAKDGSRVGFWRALLRNIVFGLAGSIVVGYFSPLFDGSGRSQGWHDKAVDAVMLDARRSAPAAPVAPMTSALPTPPQLTDAPAASLPWLAGQELPPAPQMPLIPAPQMPVIPAPAAPQAHPAPPAPPVPPVVAPSVPSDVPDETIVAPHRPDTLPDDPLISFVPGVTQQPPAAPVAPAAPAMPAAPVTPAAPAPSTPAPAAPAPATPTPLPTVQPAAAESDDIESTRISIPGHRLIFTWDDGQRAHVSGRTVFGRNPDPEAGAVVVAVRDETLSLSKTHFEAEAAPSGGWVMDRQSTNGTVVVRDGVRIDCPPGQRVPVRLGDAIEIGDRIVTIGGFA